MLRLLALITTVLLAGRAPGFSGPRRLPSGFRRLPSRTRRAKASPTMIFDFLKEQTDAFGEFVERRKREDQEAFARFTAGLEMSRDALLATITSAFGGDSSSLEESLAQLEDGLLGADIGYATTEAILDDVRRIAKEQGAVSPEDLKSVLRGRMVEVLSNASTALAFQRGGGAEDDDDDDDAAADDGKKRRKKEPTVIVVMGANGMGKTTTIGKLARRLRVEANQTVLLAACDTFRAAAVDQLRVWADRAEVDFFAVDESPGGKVSSPSAAAFKAMDVALAGNYDVVIVDTSGRLSNNDALTMELNKIKQTIAKKLDGAPHETLLVVDASVGRNAVDQARTWRDDVGVTGLVVTKLDGTSRAGFCVSIVKDLQIPVKLVGVGEALEDLQDFSPDAYVDALLDIDPKYARTDLVDRYNTLSATYLKPTVATPAAEGQGQGQRGMPSLGDLSSALTAATQPSSSTAAPAGGLQFIDDPAGGQGGPAPRQGPGPGARATKKKKTKKKKANKRR